MTVEQEEVNTIRLTGPMTLYEVSEVCETLRMALSDGKPVRIDLSDSGPWDLAGIQLLISCVADCDGIAIWRSAWSKSRDVVPRLPSDPVYRAGSSRSSGEGSGCKPDILMSKTVLHADDSAAVRRWVAEQLGEMDFEGHLGRRW